MGSTKCLVLAAALAAGMGSARADVIRYTAPLSGGWDDGGDSTILITPTVFDNALGSLRGVSIAIDGTAHVTDFYALDGMNEQDPLAVTFKAFGFPNIYGLPQQQQSLLGQFPGVGTYDQISGSGEIRGRWVIPQQYLAAYADPRNVNGGGLGIGGDLMISVGAYLKPDAPGPIAFDGQVGDFSGTMTETITYTPLGRREQPTHVPEPSSLALLGTAAAILAAATRLVRRRPRL